LLVCIFSPGAVHCLEVADGTQVWSVPLDGLGGASVLVTRGLIYARTARTLYALRLVDGAVVWKFTPHRGQGEYVYSALVISGERLFIGDREGSIHCLDPTTGARLWTATVAEGDVNSTFLVVDGLVIAGTNDSTALGVDTGSGSVVWRTRLDGPSIHEVLWDGAALVQTESLWWLNPRDGRVTDRWAPRAETAESVVVAGAEVLALLRQEVLVGFREHQEVYRVEKQGFFSGVLSFSPATGCVYDARIGEFHIVDPTTGARLCSLKYGDRGFAATHPCAANGHLYVLTDDGDVLALRHPEVKPSTRPVA
jgi:outer membrane protein assembly factor BamB